jgi:tRNA G18 (ribose-2'-O)-methylase SpoU
VLADAAAAVVVEGVNDHENLGAIFRNAAALGAGAVLLDPTCCDPLYRRSVRVSLGQVLRLPFTRLAPWPDALTQLRTAGFMLVALDPRAPVSIDALAPGPKGSAVMPGPDPRAAPQRPTHAAAEMDAVANGKPNRVAVLVGAEGCGLSEGARLAASRRVRIPMTPGVDSLNVATALAIALHRLVQPG